MSSLEAFPDMAPVPRVEVVVDPSDLMAGTATATLRRSHLERSNWQRQFLVRGAVDRPAGTPIVAMDYEAPFGVESLYEALCYNEAGTYLGAVQLGSATLEFAGTVIQQPLNPRLAVQVTRLAAMAAPVAQSAPGDLVYPEDESFAVLVGTGPRRGVEAFNVAVRTDTVEAADALQGTLGNPDNRQLQAWLIRTPPPQRIPRVFFCAVPQLVEDDRTVRLGGGQVAFRAVVTEIQPPAPGRMPAVLRYSDIAAVYGTYSAVGDVYTLYSDIARDQSLVGAAG